MAVSSLVSERHPHHHQPTQQEASKLLTWLHYAYPIVLLIFFLTVFISRSVQNGAKQRPYTPPAQTGPGGKPLPSAGPSFTKSKVYLNDELPKSHTRLFQTLSVFTALTFAANAANVVVHAIIKREDHWWCGQSTVIYLGGSFFIFLLIFISLVDSKPSPNPVHFWTWAFAEALELVLLVTSFLYYTNPHNDKIAGNGKGPLRRTMTKWEICELVINIVRVILIASMLALYVPMVYLRKRKTLEAAEHPGETEGLLGGGGTPTANGSANGYGTAPGHGEANGNGDIHSKHAAWSRPALLPSRSWWEYIRGYSIFFPYLWPSKDRRLQIIVVICFVLVLLQRVVNLAVPYQVKIITDALTDSHGEGAGNTPWGSICFFIVLKLLQGSNGILGALRSTLWIPIGQYSYRELSVAAFEHVHGLSLEFHLDKKTGEVISALGKGSSINTFLEQISFQVLPMLIDLVLAFGYFLIEFDAYYALVIAVVTFWYIYLTIRMARWRNDARRQMTNANREEDAVKNDSITSYETVKYFNAEDFEFQRYRNAVKKSQTAETTVLFSLNLLNISQNMVFMLGLMITCFIAAYQVTTGQIGVGTFTSLLQYMAQLQAPLNFFGTFYRMIQTSMINSERMLELFKEQPTVIDRPGAADLVTCEGDIRFNNVEFAYRTRTTTPALKGLDFHCAPGTTTALVGESGGGKSTVFRLLFRYYNVTGGAIEIDGRPVDDLKVDAVRKHIGVVPQDTILFHESVMYNLKYARPDCTDEEVYDACRAASIHDKILQFPEGYESKVGDRGLRLSGGERQRLAIARAILKNPRIILLDEATAALDTDTEEHIQEALATLGTGRTMLIIAHRLSTITAANQILVLHDGVVAERGTHTELLEKKGRYANMWKKQVRAQKAAEEAKVLKDKADRLRRESTTGGTDEDTSSQSEDEKKGRKAQGSKG